METELVHIVGIAPGLLQNDLTKSSLWLRADLGNYNVVFVISRMGVLTVVLVQMNGPSAIIKRFYFFIRTLSTLKMTKKRTKN